MVFHWLFQWTVFCCLIVIHVVIFKFLSISKRRPFLNQNCALLLKPGIRRGNYVCEFMIITVASEPRCVCVCVRACACVCVCQWRGTLGGGRGGSRDPNGEKLWTKTRIIAEEKYSQRSKEGRTEKCTTDCTYSGLEKSAAIRPFATKKSRLASEKILSVGSLATESWLLADKLATKLFLKGDSADADRTWSCKVRGSLSLFVRRRCKRVGRSDPVDRVCE